MAEKSDKTETETKHDVHIQWGVKIPMRDGVLLNATVYTPKDQKGRRPTIFSFTPYIAQSDHDDGYKLAQWGYPYLAVDTRGRGNSDGEFEPFFPDPADGHDVVEWIAKQPYCNGKIGMRGISYVGFTQWAAVRGDPPHLATIVPSAPCWVGLDYPFRFNVFFSFAASWLTSTWGKTSQTMLTLDYRMWLERYLRFFESGLPYKDLLQYFGIDSKPFAAWLGHPHQSEYWDRANPTPEQFAKLTMPVLSLTGIYDGDQPGTIEFHRHHLKHAGDKANHYLVIGPWDHPGVWRPMADMLGLKLGPDSVMDMTKLHRDWYRWTMGDGPRPEFLKKKVAHYVMDADKWRYVDTLEEATARVENFYLQSNGNPSDVFQSGSMGAKPPERSQPDQYVYDPRDLSRPRREVENVISRLDRKLPPGALTEQDVNASERELLYYHTAPFEKDTEVTGFFILTAWLAIDQPDTDFSAAIYDIGDDGVCTNLASTHLRARYREGLRTEKLIDTKEPLRYEFDRFFFVSRRIRKGHRLRLVIGANHTVHWQKNYNSGKPNADETMKDARTVTVKLFHDAKYPSALSVPIGRPEE